MSAVYLVRTAVAPEGDADFNAWQDQEHMPALLALPGYLGVQRFAAADEPGSYLNVWRLTDPAVFGGPDHERASHTPWFWALRSTCRVRVDFGLEQALPRPPDDPWRARVGALVVDREQPGGAALRPEPERLEALPQVVRSVPLAPLADDPAPDRRDLPAAAVVLTYLADGADARDLPDPPRGVDRRCYRPLGPYVPSPHARA